jgi:Spy/CpxP family protein refolding chaperone
MEKMVKRAKLARNLGLAEALDLDTAQATRISDSLAKLDDKRVALHKQQHDARKLLLRAAQGEKLSAADVDGALAKFFDVRAQLTALDKETLAVVAKDLSPEKKARAALFLARFQERMGRRMRGGTGPGMHGGGMGGGKGEMGEHHGHEGNEPDDDE